MIASMFRDCYEYIYKKQERQIFKRVSYWVLNVCVCCGKRQKILVPTFEKLDVEEIHIFNDFCMNFKKKKVRLLYDF